MELYSPSLLREQPQFASLIYVESFGIVPVTFTDVDGMAILDGDIVLGTTDQLKRASIELFAQREDATALEIEIKSFGVQGKRWPGGVVYYAIDPALPDQDRVQWALNYWQTQTPVKFVRRTSEANYIYFVPGNGCSSYLGMIGGRQNITLANQCTRGNVLHEVGHALGLWHEQARSDRDNYVTINWNNIQSSATHNFQKQAGVLTTQYDYSSVMHYPRTAFAINTAMDTITPKNASAIIGQRNGLSPQDIQGIRSMYQGVRMDEMKEDASLDGAKLLNRLQKMDLMLKVLYGHLNGFAPFSDVLPPGVIHTHELALYAHQLVQQELIELLKPVDQGDITARLTFKGIEFCETTSHSAQGTPIIAQNERK